MVKVPRLPSRVYVLIFFFSVSSQWFLRTTHALVDLNHRWLLTSSHYPMFNWNGTQ